MITMLQAQSNKGKLMNLFSLTRAEIERYRREFQFYCPACKELVMIKSGEKMIPHFAHYPKSNCLEVKGGEGHYHETGKLLLYQWLQSQHLQVELEPYLKEIKQQPDILLLLNGKSIAIEYQCARIPIRDILLRNEGYKQAGIIPIWILGAKQFKRQGKFHLKVDQFTSQFIHQFTPDSPKKLLYFCPETLQLTIFQDFYFTNLNQACGQFYFYKLNKMKFTDLFTKSYFLKTNLYQLWKKEKRKLRLKSNKPPYGRNLVWRQWLYLQRTHLEYLPSPIYLPVSAQHQMKTPPWDWQSRVYIGIINPIPIGQRFSIRQSVGLLRSHFKDRNHFPLIKSVECPLQQYFHLLCQLKIIQKQSRDRYIKLKRSPFHRHVEAALISDDLIMDELILGTENKIQA